ncbi:MAG: dimethylargininase [Planctomycetota bacterium]|jgi:dimethylargininase
MRHAIVRTPGSELTGGERSFLDRIPIDFELALRQHQSYIDSLTRLGCEVTVLPALDNFPDAPFVEDMAIVLPDVAVITRTGAESRRGESASVDQALQPHRSLVRMEAPACLDGGDVFRVEGTLFVGQSTRTNHAGLKQLAHLVLEHGIRVKAVEVSECLHLRTACSWLGGNHMLVNPNWIRSDRLDGYDAIEVHPDERFAATALVVGDVVLMSAACPRSIDRVREAGYEVLAQDISEFEKAEAGLTCLSLLFDE